MLEEIEINGESYKCQYRYFRNEFRVPLVTSCRVFKSTESGPVTIAVGLSICSEKDQVDKFSAKRIAKGRAITAITKNKNRSIVLNPKSGGGKSISLVFKEMMNNKFTAPLVQNLYNMYSILVYSKELEDFNW